MRTTTLPRGRNTALIRLYVGLMIVAVALTVAAALHVTRSDPRYSSTAEILVGPTITSSGNYIQPSMPTEQRVATSSEVISAASADLGVTAERPLEKFAVTVPVDTQVLVMTYTASTPEAALAGAKAFAQTYLATRNPEKGDAIARLVGPPVLPSAAVAPNYPVVLGVAVIGGLLVGFGAARGWDLVRGRVRTIDDAERTTGLDALAVTPRLPALAPGAERALWPGCPPLDSLAARVLSQVEDGPRSSVLVTGATPACGGPAVAALTALALARMGRVVLLVTADEEVLARMSRELVPLRDRSAASRDLWPVVRATEQDGLHLVSVTEWDGSGVAAARLACLLPELHDQLPEALIVIDGPAAWSSAGLALRADKVLLAVMPGRCSRTAARAAVRALDHCADKVMGLVITSRPRRTRQRIAVASGWASAHLRAAMFRFGPPSGVLAPASGVVEIDRARSAGRLADLPPAGDAGTVVR